MTEKRSAKIIEDLDAQIKETICAEINDYELKHNKRAAKHWDKMVILNLIATKNRSASS